MKKLCLVLSVVMVALLFCQFAMADEVPDASGDPAVTLVYAEVNNLDDTVVGQVALHFAERVNELTGYGENGVPKSKLLCLPFTFASRDHFWNFAGSDLAQEFMDELYEEGLGLHGLFIGEEGFRHIFCNKPVSSLDDLQGLKIRVSTDPTMVGMIKAFGAEPTVIAYSELYTSLQSGVVDGAENPVGNYKSQSFYEVAPYILLDGHQLGVIELVITDAAWNKLTEAQQACIKLAAKECQAYNKELSEKVEEDTLAELGDKITVTEVDKSEWIAKSQDVIAEATADYADLYQQIQDMQ